MLYIYSYQKAGKEGWRKRPVKWMLKSVEKRNGKE